MELNIKAILYQSLKVVRLHCSFIFVSSFNDVMVSVNIWSNISSKLCKAKLVHCYGVVIWILFRIHLVNKEEISKLFFAFYIPFSLPNTQGLGRVTSAQTIANFQNKCWFCNLLLCNKTLENYLVRIQTASLSKTCCLLLQNMIEDYLYLGGTQFRKLLKMIFWRWPAHDPPLITPQFL